MSDTSPVTTKKQNYRLWQSGAFGNKLCAWRTAEEWRSSGFGGLVALRTLGNGGGKCLYSVSPQKVVPLIDDWCRSGISPDDIMINEMAPDQDVVLQGEYLNDISVIYGQTVWGCFSHSRALKSMRDALRERSQFCYGLQADMQLKSAMTPSSYSDWQLLLKQYPKHVLEVSIYNRCLGDIPGRNALVWEVRRY